MGVSCEYTRGTTDYQTARSMHVVSKGLISMGHTWVQMFIRRRGKTTRVLAFAATCHIAACRNDAEGSIDCEDAIDEFIKRVVRQNETIAQSIACHSVDDCVVYNKGESCSRYGDCGYLVPRAAIPALEVAVGQESAECETLHERGCFLSSAVPGCSSYTPRCDDGICRQVYSEDQ